MILNAILCLIVHVRSSKSAQCAGSGKLWNKSRRRWGGSGNVLRSCGGVGPISQPVQRLGRGECSQCMYCRWSQSSIHLICLYLMFWVVLRLLQWQMLIKVWPLGGAQSMACWCSNICSERALHCLSSSDEIRKVVTYNKKTWHISLKAMQQHWFSFSILNHGFLILPLIANNSFYYHLQISSHLFIIASRCIISLKTTCLWCISSGNSQTLTIYQFDQLDLCFLAC